MARLSRRKISQYVADQLLANNTAIVQELAGYLVETGRTKEAALISRDIESALAVRGVVIADITSARTLTSDVRQQLEQFVQAGTGARRVQFREAIDEAVIGGIRLSIPGAEMDATIQRKLMKLKASKV